MSKKHPMWIMIAGPYGSGAKNEADKAARLEKLNRTALAVFNKGHVPIVGINNALPLIALAGKNNFNEIMMPLSLALAEKCDGCLRIGGTSSGADQEVERFKSAGKSVYYEIDELP